MPLRCDDHRGRLNRGEIAMRNLDLNPMQRKAAETFEGPLLILAGAGSGKTRTITARIANLLASGVPGLAILALTFTNKAAKEMRERVEKLTGSSAGDMWIGTFHSICVRILRRDIDKLGYQRSFTIYDEEDSLKVIKDTLKTLNLDEKVLPPKDVKRVISDAKNRVLTPDEWFSQSDKDYRAQRLHEELPRGLGPRNGRAHGLRVSGQRRL